jgi:molybdenum cofactor cytidylyltransferase
MIPGRVRGAAGQVAVPATGLSPSGADPASTDQPGSSRDIATRQQPRFAGPRQGQARVAVLVLAAGASSRMDGSDKLLAERRGQALLELAIAAARGSQAEQVLVVTSDRFPQRQSLAERLAVPVVRLADSAGGMSASIRAGLAGLAQATDAVIIALGDMPLVTSDHHDRLIAAFSPEDGREICRAVSGDGKPGHPVLFGRRLFKALAGLQGDAGARDLIRSMQDLVFDVPMPGEAAVRDIDTASDLRAWLES